MNECLEARRFGFRTALSHRPVARVLSKAVRGCSNSRILKIDYDNEIGISLVSDLVIRSPPQNSKATDPAMLNLTSRGKSHTCNGTTRRDFLQVGTLGAIGLGLPEYLAAAEHGGVDPEKDKRSCIMIFCSRFTLTLPFSVALMCFSLSWTPFIATPIAVAQGYEDEMYEDEMYYDQTYGGSGRSAGSVDVYTEPALAVFRSLDLKPVLSSQTKFDVRKGPALEVEANEMFAAGNHALACQLIFGHMGAEYDEAGSSLRKVRFSPLLKRPVWNLRWAVSMAIRGGDDVADPSPIPVGGSSSYDGDEMDSERAFRTPPRRGPDDFMDDEMMEDEYMDDGSMRGRSIRGGEEEQQAEPPSMLSSDAAEQLTQQLGGVAAVCAAELDKRFSASSFGFGFEETIGADDSADSDLTGPRPPQSRNAMHGKSDTNTRRLSQAVSDMISEAPATAPMWRPGVVFLGVGSSSEMIAKAKGEKIDVLLHFDIILKQQGRQDQSQVQNVSRARLIHVKAGKSMIVSKAMDSMEVRQLQASGRLSDTSRYIEEQMSGLWRTVDRELKLVDMPKLSAGSVRRRIGSLLESGGGRNLRTLAEIRLYQSQGLIESDEAINAYDIIGGSDALTMMHGPREERLTIARKWAIEAVVGEER